MDLTVKKINYRGHIIKIEYDEYPMNPIKDFDLLGEIICFHRRYNIGHEHDYAVEDTQNFHRDENFISLPVYMYDHSGIALSTSGFACQWDYAQIGIIFVSKAEIKKSWNVKRISKKLLNRIYEILKSEIDIYSKYLNGDVYGYVINNHEESCWGFYDLNYCIDEAKAKIDCMINNKIKDHVKSVKSWIKHRVPLGKREPLTIIS